MDLLLLSILPLLIETVNLLIFKEIIDRYLFIAILLIDFDSPSLFLYSKFFTSKLLVFCSALFGFLPLYYFL